jgi:hypothetical protein
MAANNTYGLKVFNDTTYASSMAALPECLNLIKTCRAVDQRLNPYGFGNDTDVNQACNRAYEYCFDAVARETALGNIEGYDVSDFSLPCEESSN